MQDEGLYKSYGVEREMFSMERYRGLFIGVRWKEVFMLFRYGTNDVNKGLKRWMDEIEEQERIKQERRVAIQSKSFIL